MADTPPMIGVEVCLVCAEGVVRHAVRLPEGSRVEQAVAQALGGRGALLGLCFERRDKGGAGMLVARWGQGVAAQALVQNGDRIDLLAPLVVDPKVARRRRALKQGRRRARR